MARNFKELTSDLSHLRATLEDLGDDIEHRLGLLDLYEQSLATCPDLFVWSVGPLLHYTFLSDGAKRTFGRPPTEMIGRYFFDLQHYFRRPEAVYQLHKLMAFQRGRFQGELLPVTPVFGETREVLWSGAPWLDQEGNFAGYRGVAIDLSAPSSDFPETNPRPHREGQHEKLVPVRPRPFPASFKWPKEGEPEAAEPSLEMPSNILRFEPSQSG